MKFEFTYLEFDSIEYNPYSSIDYTIATGINTYFNEPTLTTSSFTIHPVENSILDLLSQELDVEINKETMVKIINLVNNGN